MDSAVSPARPVRERIRVLIADDDPFVRRLLAQVLAQAEDLTVVAQCADGIEVPGALAQHPADVLLLDVRMGQMSGIDVVRIVRGFPRPPACVMITAFDDEGSVLEAIGAGADGFLLKDEDPETMLAAVRKAAQGQSPMSARSTGYLQRLIRAGTPDEPHREAQRLVAELTERERSVAVAVARGAMDKEIAEQLFIGVATVKSALAGVHDRWGTRNRAQVATIVGRSGLDLVSGLPEAR